MTKDEVIALTKQAYGPITGEWWDMDIAAMERFANLCRAGLVAEVETDIKNIVSSYFDSSTLYADEITEKIMAALAAYKEKP